MKIEELARILDKQLEIMYPDDSGDWYASFKYGEVKDGSILTSYTGRGNTPNAALRDYVKDIAGKLMVFNAGSLTLRMEFKMPFDLEAK